MGVPVYNKDNNNNFFENTLMVLFVLVILFGVVTRCSAQRVQQKAVYDTVVCDQSCIQKYVQIPNEKTGKVHIYAVYKDDAHGIGELIPVSQSVFEYIQVSKQYGLKPQLGIKLRNGKISGIIKCQTLIRVRHGKQEKIYTGRIYSYS